MPDGYGLEHSRRIEELYQIGRELGRGSFSTVYAALHKRSMAWYCVKRVKIDDTCTWDNLWNEISISLMLRHSHIVQYIDSFTKPKVGMIVMEAALGGYDSMALLSNSYIEKERGFMVGLCTTTCALVGDIPKMRRGACCGNSCWLCPTSITRCLWCTVT